MSQEKKTRQTAGFFIAHRLSSDFAALLGAFLARFEAGFAFGVVLGVRLAGIGALLAGIGAEFGNGGQQRGLLRGKAVGRVAQRQHLINRFGAVGHALVAFGKQTDAVREAGTTGGDALSGRLDERVVRIGGSRAVVVVMVFFGAGSGGEGEGSGGSAADE